MEREKSLAEENSSNSRKNLQLTAVLIFTTAISISIIMLSACSALKRSEDYASSINFDDYKSETIRKIVNERNFQMLDKEVETFWNGPQEWKPPSMNIKPQKGILLVHGLGDSPWSFHDIAQELAKEGFLVRTILLPGHGTKPRDLLTVTAEQWQKVVYEQTQALKRDVEGKIFLGGFSTGANLVLEYAYFHSDIDGLALFSPGFKSFPFDWLAPLVSFIRPWIIGPDGSFPMQTPVRYLNVPTNGYAQFYRTSAAARKLLHHNYEKPVFMAVAQNDSVLDTDYLLDVFQQRFVNPKSRLIWYGASPENLTDTERILVRDDYIPGLHISQFSHMGLLFSPTNALYGSKGSLRICLNGQTNKNQQACQRGESVWYSDWGYKEEGKIHARLTFNPYFQWQASIMVETLNEMENAVSPP